MTTNKQSPRDGLEPCPFCGGEAERFTIEEEGDNFGGDVICCKSCGASSHVEFGYKENLVSRWNTRASHPNAAEPVAWTCFHCDDTFHSEDKAREHFGPHEGRTPACQIKGSEGGLIRALREAEEEAEKAWSAVHSEGAEGLLAYRGNLSRHHAALRSAEETGYEKGLADGRAHPPAPESGHGLTMGDYRVAIGSLRPPAPQDDASADVRGLVEVTQADREAAANLASRFQRYTLMQIEVPAMRSGKHDDWEFVQTFARHRIEAQASDKARIEALEAAVIRERQDHADRQAELLNGQNCMDLRIVDLEAENARLREALKDTASRAHAVLSRTAIRKEASNG